MSAEDAQPVIVVVEDDELLLKTLTTYFRSLGWRVRGFAMATELIEALSWSPQIDCIISDVRMTPMNGMELLIELRDRGVSAPIVLMTGQPDIQLAVSAIKSGAYDYIQKPFDPESIESIIKLAIAKSRSGNLVKKDQELARSRLAQLTPRQTEIVELLIQGLTSKEIAQELGMSYRTVQAHRVAIMDRLGVDSFAGLVRLRLLIGKNSHDGV
jgi:FixJ family two-component response regulator